MLIDKYLPDIFIYRIYCIKSCDKKGQGKGRMYSENVGSLKAIELPAFSPTFNLRILKIVDLKKAPNLGFKLKLIKYQHTSLCFHLQTL